MTSRSLSRAVVQAARVSASVGPAGGSCGTDGAAAFVIESRTRSSRVATGSSRHDAKTTTTNSACRGR
jgi:hypothetical protein